MCSCSRCENCELIIERWEHGEIIDTYNACKIDNAVITDAEQLSNCKFYDRKEVVPFKFNIENEDIDISELPF